MARNVYAPTEAECEEKLARLIVQMKAKIAAGVCTTIPQS